jgi:hypothetical protein
MRICIVCQQPEHAHPTRADVTPSGKKIDGLRPPPDQIVEPILCRGCYEDAPAND